MNPLNYEPHSLCSIFPEMSKEDFSALLESIKANGYDQGEPIVRFEGKVLDGFHRLKACDHLNITPPTTEFQGDQNEAIAFVSRKNIARRHLSSSQAAVIAAELAEMMKAAEPYDRAANLQSGKGKKAAKGSKTAKAAKIVGGTSERNVAAAETLKRDNPAAFADVKAGKTTLHAAVTEVAKKKTTAERKSEEYAANRLLVERVYGEQDTADVERTLPPRDFVKLSCIVEDEMIRILPFLKSGWKLKDALGVTSVTLTQAHSIRDLIHRSIAAGGRHEQDMGTHTIGAWPKPVDPDV